MISLKESMMNSKIETDVIWDSLYGTLISAFEDNLIADKQLAIKVGKGELASQTFTYDTEDEIAVTNLDLKVAEGSKYPIKVPAVTQSTIDLYKYGRMIPITKEMQMFNQFSMMEYSIKNAGYTMGLTKDAMIWSAASSGAGQSVTYSTPLTVANIVEMIEDLESNGYDGTDFTFHPTIGADVRRIEDFFHYDESNQNSMTKTKQAGTLYGKNVHITRMVGTDVGYLLDKKHALIYAEAMPLNIETFDEKSMDLTNIKASFMGGAGVLRANAIAKLS